MDRISTVLIKSLNALASGLGQEKKNSAKNAANNEPKKEPKKGPEIAQAAPPATAPEKEEEPLANAKIQLQQWLGIFGGFQEQRALIRKSMGKKAYGLQSNTKSESRKIQKGVGKSLRKGIILDHKD